MAQNGHQDHYSDGKKLENCAEEEEEEEIKDV
jgi:hypothetical protein